MLNDNVSFLRDKTQRLSDTLPNSALPSVSPAQSFLNAFNSAKEELNKNSPVDQTVAINTTLSGTRNLTVSDVSSRRNGGFVSDYDNIEKHISNLIKEKKEARDNVDQLHQRDRVTGVNVDQLADDENQSDLFAQTMVELLESLQSGDYRPQYTAGSEYESLLELKNSDSQTPLLQSTSTFSDVLRRDENANALNKSINIDNRANTETVSNLTEHELAISQFYSNDTGVQSTATARGLSSYRSLAGVVAQSDFPSELYHEIASQSDEASS